jgi:tetratricopeptide (TPR) repeat protein
MKRSSIRWLWLVLCLGACGLLFRAPAAETNAPASPETASKTNTTNTTNSNAAVALDPELQLRTYLKLQEHMHVTLSAIELARQEASHESRTNAEALTQRLELLEQALTRQREEQWQSAQHASRTMLILAGCVIGLGLIGLVFTAVFQSRGMTRLAEIATTISQDRQLGSGSLPGLGQGEHLLLGNGNSSPAQRNLLATVERLQERIRELEKTTYSELPIAEVLPAGTPIEARPLSTRNGTNAGGAGAGGGDSAAATARSSPQAHAAALVGKAQALLSLSKVEEALACYDEAIAEAPQHADLHLRRGQALEKLKRYDDALSSYEQAITLNRGLTQAYLCKGAVFNQQERYSEALACYEMALKTSEI